MMAGKIIVELQNKQGESRKGGATLPEYEDDML